MMTTTLKELSNDIHALEYLSLNALKTLKSGQSFKLSKREWGAELKFIAKAGMKEEYHIDDENRCRSDMIKNLEKSRKIIFNFTQWTENPKSDALMLVRIPACTCIEETDPQTGIPTIVFYYGTPENNQKNIFMALIGIREFTGPYLTEPGRHYTRTTGSEAFKVLVGSQTGLSSHEEFEMIVTKLKQKGHIETQTFNALGVINIVDYTIKGPEPWIVGNILFMVRDRKP